MEILMMETIRSDISAERNNAVRLVLRDVDGNRQDYVLYVGRKHGDTARWKEVMKSGSIQDVIEPYLEAVKSLFLR